MAAAEVAATEAAAAAENASAEASAKRAADASTVAKAGAAATAAKAKAAEAAKAKTVAAVSTKAKAAAVVAAAPKPVPGPVAAVPSAKQYANCTTMHVDYKAAWHARSVDHRSSGQTQYAPVYSAALYDANSGSDRDGDGDGRACEQEQTTNMRRTLSRSRGADGRRVAHRWSGRRQRRDFRQRSVGLNERPQAATTWAHADLVIA
jgi:hypothetical protein